MKVVCVIDALGSGGAQRQLIYLLSGLVKRGYEVKLFVYRPGSNHFRPAVESLNVPIIEVCGSYGRGFSFNVLRDLYFLARNDADLVISFQPNANFYSAIVKLFGATSRLLVSQRTSSMVPQSKYRKWMSYSTYVVANSVTVNSESESAILRTALPRLAHKIHTIWNGYELSNIPKIRNSELDNRKLLVVGRVAYMKNGLRLMQALRLFYQKHGWLPHVSWAGRREEGAHSRQIQHDMDKFLTDDPIVAENWMWLGEVDNVQQHYLAADALVHVSLFEGLPNAICEAMLTGCPVIASKVCDHPSLLGNGERGILCDPMDVASICQAIEQFYSLSCEMRVAMAEKAQRFAEKNLSVERMVDSYEALLIQQKM